MSAILPPHPLDKPGVLKIRLGASATEAVAKLGKYAFAVISQGDSTTSEAAGHAVLYVTAATQETLNAAFQIVKGTHRAVIIK